MYWQGFHYEVELLYLWWKWSYLSGTYRRRITEQKYHGCYCVKWEFEKALNIQTVVFRIVTPFSLFGCYAIRWWTLEGNSSLQNFVNCIHYTGIQRFCTMRKGVCSWYIFGRWIQIKFQNFSITHNFRSRLELESSAPGSLGAILPWAPFRSQGFLLLGSWYHVLQWCLFRYGSSWPWM